MISFKQFLVESDQPDLIQFLRKNCDEAVHDMYVSGKAMWRGTKVEPRESFTWNGKVVKGQVIVPRTDRRPKDMPKWAHNLIDDFFYQEFGVTPRSSAVFASTSRANADEYAGSGNPKVVIPIGRYSVIWSPVIQDLFTVLFPDIGYNPNEVTREMQEQYVLDILKNSRYTETSLKSVKGQSELMVMCQRYLLLDVNDADFYAIIEDAAGDERVEQ